MNRNKIATIIFTTLCVISLKLIAIAPDQALETKSNLRILDLLPNLVSPLGVNPAIPDDFVAMSKDGELDPCDWIYWGPKDVVEGYIKNHDSLSRAIIGVSLSYDALQTGPNQFSIDLIKEMKKMSPRGFAGAEHHWGNYPVRSTRTLFNNMYVFNAWVGLNDPDSGAVLLFTLLYPVKQGRPNKEDLQLWNNLLNKTTALSDQDFFRAMGQDMQPGYTIVNVGGAKLKFTAEKRERDGLLQVVVVPLTPNTEFDYDDMMEGLLGSKWKFMEPLVKVHGTIMAESKNYGHVIQGYTASILLEPVQEFSVDREKMKNRKDFFIYQK